MATKPKKFDADRHDALKAPDSPRVTLLKRAIEITTKDRNASYGDPEDNFANIAAYWSRYLSDSAKLEIIISPQDVAHLMILMKIARLSTNPNNYDSLLDVAGYAACGVDCMVRGERKEFENCAMAGSAVNLGANAPSDGEYNRDRNR